MKTRLVGIYRPVVARAVIKHIPESCKQGALGWQIWSSLSHSSKGACQLPPDQLASTLDLFSFGYINIKHCCLLTMTFRKTITLFYSAEIFQIIDCKICEGQKKQ